MENVESQARPQTAIRHPKLAMVSMLLGAFVGMFSETSLNIALPKLGEAFGMSAATLQWLVTGRIYDNIGAKKSALVGLIIALVGALMLAVASDHAKIGYIIAAHVILMIGAPLAMSPAQTAALNALSGREAGDGSTILNTVQQVIGALATALATSCLELGRHAASGSAQARFTAGAHVGFYFTLALIIIALVVATQLKGRPVGHSIKLDK